jgi:hypothetical protein
MFASVASTAAYADGAPEYAAPVVLMIHPH